MLERPISSVFIEGAVSPLAEADPLLRRLIETGGWADVERRREILSDPEFIEAFRTMWSRGKSGFNGAPPTQAASRKEFLTRDLNDMQIYRSNIACWPGQTMARGFITVTKRGV